MTTLFPQRIREQQHALWLALLTIGLSVGWFLVDGRLRLNLADEGFLWYGTEALRLGQVPMRDFQGYDPGRYLWTFGWSFFLGQGVVSLRLACVFFQCLGVLAGLLAARRLSRHWLFLTCVALLLCAWMHPRFKVFEQSVALMAVYAGVLLLEQPSLRRHWWVGVFGGLAAFVGRNHGAYHVLAFGLLITWGAWGTDWRTWLRRSGVWGAGLLAGYLPQWLMFVFVPGYFEAYLPYLSGILSKGTNLGTSVPWPWLVPAHYPLWLKISRIAEGCFYVAIPAFLVLAGFRAWRLGRRSSPVLLATACVSLPYAHSVFSRADIVHLTHGAPTVALGLIALVFSFGDRGFRLGQLLAPILMGGSFLATLFQFGVTAEVMAPANSLFSVQVKGESMLVGAYYAKILSTAEHVARDLAKPDEPVIFLPLMPGLYPFTGRLSPIKRIYFNLPSPEEDRALLAEIEAAGVQWVMLQDYALDERDDLRFKNANPLVFEHFRKNFGKVNIPGLPQDTIVLHRQRAISPP